MRRCIRGILAALALICAAAILPVTAQAAAPKLNKTELTTYVTCKTKLKVKNAGDKKITWSSSNPEVAAVSKKGKVTGIKKGTATITAKVGKKKLTCKVTVKQELKVAKKKITIGKSGKLKCWLYQTDQKIGATVADSKICGIKFGKFDGDVVYLKLKGKKNGKTTIVINNSFNKEQYTVEVTVKGLKK